jgi:hypothetical protein
METFPRTAQVNLTTAALPRESEVVALWQKAILSRRLFVDLEGGLVQVVYPGRPNDARGADFRDALIRWKGRTQLGSIEVHSAASAWKAHGHHRDPRYNDVVLHVAWYASGPLLTLLENGRPVPTLILSRQDLAHASPVPVPACRQTGGRQSVAWLQDVLAAMGERRFEDKARRFSAEIDLLGAGQSLYLGLLEALGYSHNQTAFRQLGRSLPLSALENAGGLREIQARLLGSAGFLAAAQGPDELSGSNLTHLQHLWQRSAPNPPPPVPDWDLFKIRPSNHPVRRLMALAQLLRRFHKDGLLASLVRRLETGGKPSASSLIAPLLVACAGGRRRLLGWGGVSPRAEPHWLGPARAAEIAVNVWLPFALAFSLREGLPGLEGRAKQLYAAFPRLEVNSLERHICQQLGLKSGHFKTARLQQGALHLYRNFCLKGACRSCPLNRE